MRGDVKTQARKHVAHHFGFSELARLTKGPGDSVIAAVKRCRDRAVHLLGDDFPEGNVGGQSTVNVPMFFYKVSPSLRIAAVLIRSLQDFPKETGMLKHPVFQDIVNDTWFKNSQDDGVALDEYSDGVTVPMLARLCALR